MTIVLSFGTTSTLLSKQWTTESVTGLVLGMIASVILCVLFELVHLLQGKGNGGEREERSSDNKKENSFRNKFFSNLKTSSLHTIRVTIGYVLMLFVMTYNVWLIISVLLGSGLGYFFCRPWVRSKQNVNTSSYVKNQENDGDTAQPLMLKADRTSEV